MPENKHPPHAATVGLPRSAQASLEPVGLPHLTTLQPDDRPGALPLHPATVTQKKSAPGAPAARPPHPATVQPRTAQPASPAAKSPHAATVAQKKPDLGAPAARPPSPAMAQLKTAQAASPAAKPAHPATVQPKRPGYSPGLAQVRPSIFEDWQALSTTSSERAGEDEAYQLPAGWPNPRGIALQSSFNPERQKIESFSNASSGYARALRVPSLEIARPTHPTGGLEIVQLSRGSKAKKVEIGYLREAGYHTIADLVSYADVGLHYI